MKIALVLISLCFGCASLATAKPAALGPVLSASDLLADAGLVRRAYEELHPGLYRYNDKAAMDAHFAALEQALAQDQPLSQAFLAFSRFAATIECGHTQANPFNQSKALVAALFSGANRVPFYFRWIDRRIYISRSFSSTPRLGPGVEVRAINQVPVAQILATLLTIARADGSNDAKRINQLEVTGDSAFETFDLYLPLFFPAPEGTVSLRINGAAGEESLTVPALTPEDRAAALESFAKQGAGDGPLFNFKELNPLTGYLRMPTWVTYNSKWDWQAFIDATFDRLVQRGTANLIVDLRGNEGGTDVGNAILARLIGDDLRLTALQRRVRYRKVPADLLPFLETWDPSFKDWGLSALGPENGFYRLKRVDDDGAGAVIKPSRTRYRGRVYVLVDAANSSATFQFAQVIQVQKLGILAGQPTGGNQRGINGGAFFFLRLPKSGIELDLPLIGTFALTGQPDAGLTPDLLIKLEPADLAAGTDAVLSEVERRIGAN